MLWYEKPLRIAALQCESEGDPARVLDAWEGMGFNVEQLLHISAEGYIGYLRDDQMEKVQRYLAGAKARGLRIIFYVGVLGPKEVRSNEAWAFRDGAGKSLGMPCVNSPFHDWYVEHIRKIAALDVDGIFLDGPFFPTGSCYCDACRELFRREYGTALPTVADFADKAWRDFIQFRNDSIIRLVRDCRNAMKSVKPDAILYTNGQPLGPGSANGRNNRMLAACEDMLGAEGGFIFYEPPDRVPWWKPGVTARLLEGQSEGKPTVVFIAGDHKTWNRYLLTAPETRLLIAAAAANGASPWYGIHSPIEDLQAPGGQAAGDMMRFLRDNEACYTRTESLAEVALLWSQRTADYFSQETAVTDFTKKENQGKHRIDYTACFGGFAEMLLRRQMPFDVMDDQKLLEGGLGKYKTIILPDFACASDEELEALKGFVRAGGHLVASFETSLYRPDLTRRADLGLSDLFGASLQEGLYDFQASSYMSRNADDTAFAGISQTLLPAPAWGLKVRPTTATPWAYFHEPLAGQYLPVPPRATPAITANRYGKGRCIYLAGSFGEHFKTYGIPEYPAILANVLDAFSPALIRAENLPETVELTLRTQREAGRLMVHLVNFTGTMRRPISRVVRIHEASLAISAKALRAAGIERVGRVSALRGSVHVAFSETAEGLALKVPAFDEYEVLLIQP